MEDKEEEKIEEEGESVAGSRRGRKEEEEAKERMENEVAAGKRSLVPEADICNTIRYIHHYGVQHVYHNTGIIILQMHELNDLLRLQNILTAGLTYIVTEYVPEPG